ncbi:dienelactone hydrolase family protein [Demequina sp. SYSU T00192]|uniref:Dienelactone hydrolase family protein n=1 Tax=Demequina litoralis TaxID=3051660 RepID=A0ABT8GAZ7_9MICO|nr:dienelactone hydrolase family protein [Demequina sp. SYSU T00192]MDN4476321.1 dienelactone hydrolase family protein [Demequina sp. SYSU T00192]
MAPLVTRDIDYTHDGTLMRGLLVAPEGAVARPGIVLFHDAFGLSEDTIAIAERLAGLGLSVFAADVWGDRLTPTEESEIGPLIGGMAGDRTRWLGRVAAAHETAAAQPEIDRSTLISMGHCFGASSALEHLRTGGDVRAVVAIHAGLDLLAPGWEAAHFGSRVLVCTGSEDPMATAEMRAALQDGLDSAGIDWELDLYSGTRHAFTNPKSAHSPMPDVVAYHPRSAARAWIATERFLGELIADLAPAPA